MNGSRLSPHLTLAEVTKSANATRLGLDNSVPPNLLPNLQRLAVTLFEPLRDRFGPLIVSSGYRSPRLNALTPGSSLTSAHVYGCALDVEPVDPAVRLSDMMRWAQGVRLPFDQLIYEYGDWLHIAIEKPGHKAPRRLLLQKFAGQTYQIFDPAACPR